MNNKPDISVIVPCYNAGRYLSVCLESLRAQRTPQMEFIFIDDGSTDATGALLDRFALEEPRARVTHRANEGVSAARNLGLSMAQGRYIAFVDADNALEEGSLSRLHQFAVRSGAQIVSANHTLFDMSENRRVPVNVEPVVQQPLEVAREIIHLHRIYNNIWNKLYDRELFSGNLALAQDVRVGEDALLNLQLYLRARHVEHLQESTYVYRVHRDSATAEAGGFSRAHRPMLRAMDGILRREGVKELYFRDFLQSCVWIDEKEKGIRACMRTFNEEIAPLVLGGVDAARVPQKDRRLYALVAGGRFPLFYQTMRVREKLTHRRWGIRR